MAKTILDSELESMLSDIPDNIKAIRHSSEPVPLERIFPGEENAAVRKSIREKGHAKVGDRHVGAFLNQDGYVTAIAAKVPRTPTSTSYETVSSILDFDDDNTSRSERIPLFYKVYKKEGLINNAINKTAAFVSAEGEFYVRRARIRNRKIAHVEDELGVALNYWKRNVNAVGLDGPVTGARGLSSIIDQGTRQALIEGSWVAYQHYSSVNIPQIGKSFELPMFLQSLSSQYVTIPQALVGTGLEQFYWEPPNMVIQDLVDSDDPDVTEAVNDAFDPEVLKQLAQDRRVKLEKDRVIHVKHRGVDTEPFGECYDEETEILTRLRGWVRFSNLSSMDEVATRAEDGTFQWQRPTAYTEHDHNGKMYHFTSETVDLMVTPNHRMLTYDPHTAQESVVFAENTGEVLYIPTFVKWDPRNRSGGHEDYPDSPRNAPSPWTLAGDDVWAAAGKDIAKGDSRALPQGALDSDPSKLMALWNELWASDDVLNIRSLMLVDQLTEMAAKLGKVVTVDRADRGWNLRYFPEGASEVRRSTAEYRGKVYCVQVPNGIVLVRRRGKMSWSGNSFIEPVLSSLAYRRALQTLDLVIIESLINRILILKVGSDNPNSAYHNIEFAQQRMNVLSNMFDSTDPSMVLLWAGPDIDVIDVGVHESLAKLDGRFDLADRRMIYDMGIPENLLTGGGGSTQQWAAYEGYRETLRSMQNSFAQAMMALGEQVAIRNGYEGVELEFKFSRGVLADQNANADLAVRLRRDGLASIRSTIAATGGDYLSERRNRLMERGMDPDGSDNAITDEELFSPPYGLPGETRPSDESPGRPPNTQTDDFAPERAPENRNPRS